MTSTVKDAVPTQLFFQWLDYLMFALMLAVSALIGVYFGCFGSRQKTTSEYLMGGKKMKILPVAVSLVASHISAITLLGLPSEVYTYGTQYTAMAFCCVITGGLITWLYLPVFYTLQLTSVYEYLEIRFSRSVRSVASLIFLLSLILYVPIVVYLPALAFSQVSGMSLHAVTPIVSCVCIFYTMLGGLKAVVWTDFVQQVVMVAATIIVIIIGLIDIGGFSNMWRINAEGHRLEFFNMDPDPFARATFLTITIGISFSWLAQMGVNQAMCQRLLSVPTMNAARWTMFLYTVGMIICKLLSILTGMLIYAHFHDCDPALTGIISRQDQLLPYYVMKIAAYIPGLPGLFVAGVFSAALSTMSTCLNTVSGTVYEDFLSRCMSPRTREKRAGLIMRIIVLVVGVVCVLMVFVIEKFGGAMQMAISLNSITFGALLGLFSLGMFCPWANTKGALAGGLASLLTMGALVTGAQIAVTTGKLVHPKKPVSLEGCPHLAMNITDLLTQPTNTTASEPDEYVFVLFRISFMYFIVIGFFTAMVVGVVVSFLTGPQDPKTLDRDLITPSLHRWLPYESSLAHKEKKTVQPLILSKDTKNGIKK
ncbi:sodium-coupled monocarboxylate transporter 2 [Anabrus simplex]|uniref:sodium-coupled monocarboxylate transporter 2 n=1 Tax=Anabrus simplex TaxID=316456 RepID=UPI0035A2C574